MNDYNMDGVGHINGGVFGNMKVDGVATCTSDIKAENIRLNGVFKCQGAVDAGLMQSDGTAEFSSNIRAKK